MEEARDDAISPIRVVKGLLGRRSAASLLKVLLVPVPRFSPEEDDKADLEMSEGDASASEGWL